MPSFPASHFSSATPTSSRFRAREACALASWSFFEATSSRSVILYSRLLCSEAAGRVRARSVRPCVPIALRSRTANSRRAGSQRGGSRQGERRAMTVIRTMGWTRGGRGRLVWTCSVRANSHVHVRDLESADRRSGRAARICMSPHDTCTGSDCCRCCIVHHNRIFRTSASAVISSHRPLSHTSEKHPLQEGIPHPHTCKP
jgi:hypothetical protein